MDRLDALHVFSEVLGQGQKVRCAAILIHTPPDASRSLHSQRRRQVETPRFEVEFWIHKLEGTTNARFFI